ncbi:hypothetical protein, partial [Streptomyces sp. MMG1121]|uniref:hypothetical protein n=1 Tax=Streptomyces sp. MMG1121 TaxID=1415544 RepID=UPI001F48FE76
MVLRRAGLDVPSPSAGGCSSGCAWSCFSSGAGCVGFSPGACRVGSWVSARCEAEPWEALRARRGRAGV